MGEISLFACWYIIMVCMSPIVIIFTHEFSHAFVAWWKKYEIISFTPWPHVVVDRLLLGSVSYRRLRCTDDTFVAFAPIVKSVLSIALMFIVASWWPPIMGLLAYELMDIGSWLDGYNSNAPMTDGYTWKVRHMTRACMKTERTILCI